MHRLLSDRLTALNLTETTPKNIAIIDINDYSLDTLGSWPWPRELVTQLVDNVFQNHNPRGVALDIIFPEPRDTIGDARLAKIIEQNPVCLSIAFHTEQSNIQNQIGHIENSLTESPPHSQKAYGYTANHKTLSQASTCQGHISAKIDSDGITRKTINYIQWRDKTWASLPLALFKQTNPDIDVNLPAISHIPFKIKTSNWPSYSAVDIIFEQIPANTLDDYYLFIGSSALGIGSSVTTPLSPWTSGVTIHTEIFNSLLHGEEMAPWFDEKLTILFSILSILILSISFAVLGPLKSSAIGLLLILSWLSLLFTLKTYNENLLLALPFLSIVSFIIIQIFYEWFETYLIKQKTVNLFKGYLSDKVVDQILNSEKSLLKPQLKNITVMFADIEGFTKLSKELNPKELSDLTNEVLTLLTGDVFTYEGTLDKYIGDAIMAFWNAPTEQSNHADLAVQCATTMLATMDKFNRNRETQPDIKIRIGIHTGQAVVGSFGSSQRYTYTAIGDTVNEAFNLHELTKQYQSYILISAQTKNLLRSQSISSQCSVHHFK